MTSPRSGLSKQKDGHFYELCFLLPAPPLFTFLLLSTFSLASSVSFEAIVSSNISRGRYTSN